MKKTITIIAIVALVIALIGTGIMVAYFTNEINDLHAQVGSLQKENAELKDIVDHHEMEVRGASFDAYWTAVELYRDGKLEDVPEYQHYNYEDDFAGHIWEFNGYIDELSMYNELIAKGLEK